ncbi:hypothetical protein [Micromonospora sp. NPDC050276]|uniref:hypothetical protein n=1 Tax=Micromonospora sp. NPDC050276 TaxID=3364278 RepID=UPI0037B13208
MTMLDGMNSADDGRDRPRHEPLASGSADERISDHAERVSMSMTLAALGERSSGPTIEY